MSYIREMLARGAAGCLLTAVLLAGVAKAPAQNLDLEQRILKALTPTPNAVSRSLTTTPRDTSQTLDRQFLDTLKNRTPHSLTTDERERLATIARERPSIDIEINFDYGSERVGPAAMPSVTALGKALTNPDIKGSTFVLAGHTDAKGGYPFNQDLSERRADSVKRYLVDHFQIPASPSSRSAMARPSSRMNPIHSAGRTAGFRSSTWKKKVSAKDERVTRGHLCTPLRPRTVSRRRRQACFNGERRTSRSTCAESLGSIPLS